MENWKDVLGYENLYEVSDLGRVRRKESFVKTGIKHNELRKVKSTMLKQNLKKNGYLTVDLSKDWKVKTISVHRLVAIAFCKKDSEEQTVVDHVNCNKTDNRAENLQWVSPKENRDRAKNNHLYHAPNKKKVLCVESNKEFESSYEAAEYINVHFFKNTKTVRNIANKIRSCCNGRQKIAYGFAWKFI